MRVPNLDGSTSTNTNIDIHFIFAWGILGTLSDYDPLGIKFQFLFNTPTHWGYKINETHATTLVQMPSKLRMVKMFQG